MYQKISHPIITIENDSTMNDKNQIENREVTEEKKEGFFEREMDRKEALRKAGFIALSAATMMLLLNKPNKAVASSPAPPPVW
jgi:hypothetical protein